MNLLSLENITKAYTERVLLDGASFFLQEGEKVGIIGINGSRYDASGRPAFNAVLIRKGQIYNRALGTSYSLMAIKRDGTMYTPKQGLSAEQLVADGVYDTFDFGPAFIMNGRDQEIISPFEQYQNNPYPRSAVGMIRPEDKTRYHCAAAVATNLEFPQMKISMELIQMCGFSEENALTALRPILKGNMAHIASDGPEKSLTGPVERNDEETIQKHLQCLETAEDRQLYRLLSRRITGLAQHRHPERDYTEIRQLLRKDGSK